VIVGAVPTGFSRANYYKKELDLRMSLSYGPGRNDASYEEKGIDYPAGYVRFTENRNMQTFVDLAASGKIDMEKIITHEFKLSEAPKAYDMILSKTEYFSGILIKYDDAEPQRKVFLEENSKSIDGLPNVGFIGAGNFAQNILLPRMKDLCNFRAIATSSGNESRFVSDKYGFSFCADTGDEVIEYNDVNTVFVVTRHNLHASYVIKALRQGKHVFVEKPLAMTENELETVKSAFVESNNKNGNKLMLGFNRRFSPAVREIVKLFPADEPRAIQMRINAGAVPPEHWVNDPETGGGRIIGEACHFIDLAMHLAGSLVISVSASTMADPNNLNDTVIINLEFRNGSVGSISYFSNGNKTVPKEHIEVFCGGTVAIVDDFKRLHIYGTQSKKIKYRGQDKGHASGVRAFLKSITTGDPCPIPFEESYHSTLATFKVLQSIRENRKILI